jgi:phage shock protein PspC (stress-responsive transcriptional regulator)
MTTQPESSNVSPDPAPGFTQPGLAAPASPGPAFSPPAAAFTPPAPTSQARPYRKIRRNRDDRVIAGVAGGLGRYVNVDPVIFRILFVALTLFGGSGILLYLFAWIGVPEDGSDDAPINRVISRVRRRRR